MNQDEWTRHEREMLWQGIKQGIGVAAAMLVGVILIVLLAGWIGKAFFGWT